MEKFDFGNREVGHEEMREKGVAVFDVAGQRVPHVRSFKQTPDGLVVKMIVPTQEGRFVLAGCRTCGNGRDVAEASMLLRGGLVQPGDWVMPDNWKK